MKFTKGHYESLKSCVEPIFSQVSSADKTEIRYLWDLFWASRWTNYHHKGDYTDAHITSAMRKIVRELEKVNQI